MLWQKITHFLTVEELETAQHMWIYEQYNSKYMCSQDTHKPLLPWEVKGKGLQVIKHAHLPGGALHLCEGGRHCVTVNFYPLQLYLLLDNVVLCRLTWVAEPLACYQALQENFVSAPAKKEQTPRIRRKLKKKKKSSPKPTTTQGDLIYPNPL